MCSRLGGWMQNMNLQKEHCQKMLWSVSSHYVSSRLIRPVVSTNHHFSDQHRSVIQLNTKVRKCFWDRLKSEFQDEKANVTLLQI